jgi:uncharacterized protein (DUF1810 family)
MADSFNLHRLLNVQTPVYGTILTKLRAGKKSTH